MKSLVAVEGETDILSIKLAVLKPVVVVEERLVSSQQENLPLPSPSVCTCGAVSPIDLS